MRKSAALVRSLYWRAEKILLDVTGIFYVVSLYLRKSGASLSIACIDFQNVFMMFSDCPCYFARIQNDSYGDSEICFLGFHHVP